MVKKLLKINKARKTLLWRVCSTITIQEIKDVLKQYFSNFDPQRFSDPEEDLADQ